MAAVGFPVIILALIPLRMWVLPKWFKEEELRVLDKPTASPFTMVSVGGNFGESAGDEGEDVGGQSGSASEGVLVGGERDRGEDSEEARAERGEGGVGVKRRESWKLEERSGRWGLEPGGSGSGESYEMKKPGVMRRSVSRTSK